MRVFLDSVGCKLNQSEIEKYAAQFHEAGHILVGNIDAADVYVLNTCAVTAAASSDSRQKLRQAVHRNPKIQIIATGCLVSLDDSIKQIIPQINRIVPNEKKDSLVNDFLGELPDLDYYERQTIPGSRRRTRAFIKVQDGCDNYCTYCITRLARGASRSVDANLVLSDIQGALVGGAKEIVLTGVHLASYGMDIHPETSLSSLLKQILADLPRDIRVRVSSLEPWDLTPDFFDLWKDVRLCPHFHLPLQSGADAVLHRMARKVTTGEYRHLVDELLLRVPDAAITTDIIVGFPGETDVEFNETLEFVQSIPFAGGHVFSYSAREGTGAARMPDQIHGNIKRQRSGILRNVMAELAHNYQMRFLGETVQVLWESSRKMDKAYLLSGHSPNYLRVDALSIQPMRNQYSLVKIDKINEKSCEGTLSTQVMRE